MNNNEQKNNLQYILDNDFGWKSIKNGDLELKNISETQAHKKISFSHFWHVVVTSLKWILFGILCGGIVGVIATYFGKGIHMATDFRMSHPYIIAGLPFAGLLIVFMYRITKQSKNKGTNQILECARRGEHVPFIMAPLIFASTILTHLFGGSAGREGAALQLGGALGNFIGHYMRLSGKDRRIVILSGMSAAFSALFGTPLAAAVLSLEISTVGIMYYPALAPCVISSLTAHLVSTAMGSSAEAYALTTTIAFDPKNALFIFFFSILAGLVSILFCISLNRAHTWLAAIFKNEYIRIFAAGTIIAVLTFLIGNQNYIGSGSAIIEQCMDPKLSLTIPFYACFLKIFFTSLTLPSGYRGGEIVPSLFIGATLGCAYANLLGLNAPIYASVGMGAVFCAVTNCPLTALLICFELFGFEMMPFYLLAVSLTFVYSGSYGIYRGQKIRFSKYDDARIDENAHQ